MKNRYALLLSLVCLFFSPALFAQEITRDVIFEWDEAECSGTCTSVDGYRIYVAGGGLLVDTATVGTSYTAVNYALTVGQDSCFTIAAYNESGEAVRSDEACVRLAATAPGKTTLRVTFSVN